MKFAKEAGLAVKEIIKSLEPLGKLLGKSASALWSMCMKEVAVDLVLYKIWAMVCLVLCVAFSLGVMPFADRDWWGVSFVFGVTSFGFLIGFFSCVTEIVGATINPELRALEYILNMAKKDDE